MKVWVLNWENSEDGNREITLWETQEAARQQACYEIQNAIESDWDMEDHDDANQAQLINEAIKSKKYALAIEYWNEHESERDYGQFWSVCKKDVLALADASTPDIHADDFFIALCPEEEDEEDEEEDEEVDDSPYQASIPGATCRGPCKSYNDMAYADKRDGTYCCYQCKTFAHIFGKKP